MKINKRGKNTRITNAIYEYLVTTQPKTIREIEAHLMKRYKNTPDYHALGSIMGKSVHFKKAGFVSVKQITGGFYKAVLWSV